MSPNKLLLSYASRYPVWIVLTIILGFSSAIFNGISVTLIVPLVIGFLSKDSLDLDAGPPLIRNMLSFFGNSESDNGIILMFAAVILAIILKNLTSYVTSLVSFSLAKRLVNDIRKAGIKLILEVDLDYFVKIKTGDLVNKVNQEVGRAASAIKTAIQLFITFITILIFVAILITISWKLTVAATILLMLVTWINQYFVKRSSKFGKVLSDKSRVYSTSLLEILTGIRLIKAVGNEEVEYQRIKNFLDEREQAEYQSQANFAILGPINEILGILAILAIVFLGKAFLFQDVTPKALIAVLGIYLFVLNRLIPVVGKLNGQRSQFANAAPSTEITANFLRRDNKPFMTNGNQPYHKIKQGISIKNVSFAYPEHQDLVLSQINLWVPKGTTLALVGSSGAGKSTLADLFPRFYDPVEGKITIDGQDLREYDLRSLRQAMGIVSQDTFLFNTSVGDNIAYGRDNTTEEEIIEAAKRANAYEFILDLPQGFDTEIGERGIMLSGGQRQRIAIARALLRNPDILILDEATSALDTVSERLVQQAIDELCRDRTTIVIAHRLSTIQKADQIAVMDKGQVVEIGTHEELLQQNGHYSRLYTMQFDRGPDDVITQAVNNALVRTSYEVRTRLNPMIGFLQLVADGLVDNREEQLSFTKDAYNSALRLLKTLEYFEESSKTEV
ncbi:MAG: ABC transporter ATP-binding protein [Symploca sp. SIO1C2]|nr:ABC transporter ATP-binding protein [Symploca sp. SIO1C2]NER47919.1 ABC transporter ATP-binding protein [Symploca sp. SIO1A3]